jgi:hypothetical protein
VHKARAHTARLDFDVLEQTLPELSITTTNLQHTGVRQNVDIRTRHCTYDPIRRPPTLHALASLVPARRCRASHHEYSMGRLADSPFRSSTARATCSVALPAPSPSSSSTARRSSLCDARPSTSPASSSARSVRTHPPTTSERRKGQTTMRAIGGYGVRRMASRRCALWLLFGEALSGQLLNWKTATDSDTVKYSAFLRKQTRYNPTRGGTYPHLSISHKPLPGSAITSGMR